MKMYLQLILLLLAAGVNLQAQSDTLRFDPEAQVSDSVEYELIVLDPGYESYLVSQPHMEFYSQSYYENWNYRYVMEWNYRYMQPLRYGDLFEVYIDYQPEIDYGLELNYRLFHYFRFFEKENDIDLLPEKVF
ncbi:DUF6146 family protein [Bacteroidota bacterium]